MQQSFVLAVLGSAHADAGTGELYLGGPVESGGQEGFFSSVTHQGADHSLSPYHPYTFC